MVLAKKDGPKKLVFYQWTVLYGCLSYFNLSGVLACLDGYMNIALEQTEEYSNGQVRVEKNLSKRQENYLTSLP